ncbi:DoxX family protein [Helicobacter marmotae]|uniref:DoxX family protein n=1 Tax=Helicobacter marmotae TaxID=152490 RepID=A0A3D8I7I4_9HELI|nr:DoxX family protein [Helicobacter marmotae]RDU60956.1 DoxX family protein [Helicobacter marmotae]
MFYNQDIAKLLLRLCVGGLMLFHGIYKIMHGIGGVEGMIESRGLPGVLAYGVYITEVLAPLMILVGYQVRIAAIIEALGMLVAIYAAVGFDIFALNAHGAWVIEPQLLFLLPCITLALIGGGRYGVSFRS